MDFIWPFYSLEACRNGDVMLERNGTPLLFLDNKWSPICGHYFWDTVNGAKAFCKRLAYPSGTLQRIGHTYSEDSVRVGYCNEGEDLLACTGGCNEYETGYGNGNSGSCTKNDKVSVSITCVEQSDIFSSCGLQGNDCKYTTNQL